MFEEGEVKRCAEFRAALHLSLPPALWLDKSKMITLVCVQGSLRKSSLQLNKQGTILTMDSWRQVHRAL